MFCLRDVHVVHAERRGDVDDARAVFGADEIARDDVGVLPLDRQEGIERVVAHAEQVFALEALDHLVFVRVDQRRLDQIRRQDQLLGAFAVLAVVDGSFDLHVIDVLADRQRDVRRERPGRRRPDEEVDAGLIAQREAHEHAGVLHVLVAERDFVAAQRRAAARAVRDDLQALCRAGSFSQNCLRIHHTLSM